MQNNCPLCGNIATPFYKEEFLLCPVCEGIFRPSHLWLSPAEEKARYENHENDADDPGYRQFVAPITNSVLKEYTPQHAGLDFGSGKDSSASKVLQERGFNIVQYDPFFDLRPELLQCKYDFIVCCEVMEHFRDPRKEFELLNNLLNPGGTLYCMTHIYSPDLDFEKWYYKNDPTHIFIYQKSTLKWIKTNLGFAFIVVQERLVKLTK